MKIFGFLLLALVILLPTLAAAKDMPYLQQPGDFFIQNPTNPVPKGEAPNYGPSGAAPNWHISAWSIPGGQLSPFATTQHGDDVEMTAKAAEASVVITRKADGSESYTLSQDGTVLPCNTSAGQPRESDLFASPNGKMAAPNVSGLAVSGDVAIADMTRLRATETVSLRYANLKVTKGCGVSQGGAMIAVILNNPTAHQTLFYQLGLGAMCGPQPAARAKFCESVHAHPHSNFFFQKNPFGVDDNLALFGQSMLANGESRSIDVDLLPHLIHFIQTSPEGMDHDPSHWFLHGYYNGQNIWGDVSVTTTWQNPQLTISTR